MSLFPLVINRTRCRIGCASLALIGLSSWLVHYFSTPVLYIPQLNSDGTVSALPMYRSFNLYGSTILRTTNTGVTLKICQDGNSLSSPCTIETTDDLVGFYCDLSQASNDSSRTPHPRSLIGAVNFYHSGAGGKGEFWAYQYPDNLATNPFATDQFMGNKIAMRGSGSFGSPQFSFIGSKTALEDPSMSSKSNFFVVSGNPPTGTSWPIGCWDSDSDGDNDTLDSDGDRMPDVVEDADHDGTRDASETKWDDSDTDDDGIIDSEEYNPSDPETSGAIDVDGNGTHLRSHRSNATATDPTDSDSDNDGLSDGLELGISGDMDSGTSTTDPNDNDTDNDGQSDGTEDANHDGTTSGSCDTNPNSNASITLCGNGTVNSCAGSGRQNESCDASGEGASCDDDCTAVSCGDGNTNEAAGETCDDGADNGTATHCNATCNGTTTAVCGNGIVETGEGCDDGDSDNTDSCPDGTNGTCETATCGDGFRYSTDGGSEACDDGETYNLSPGPVEYCTPPDFSDDGACARNNGDGCSNSCAEEANYTCTESGARSTCSFQVPDPE